jgi:Calcineurin-like phosphoesterase
MRRTILCLALLAVALGAAFLATRARRLGFRVESFAVAPGGDIDNAPKLGDDLAFAPFRFAVVSRVEGDHAALAAAMDAICARGDVDFVVLGGDVLGVGDDSECRRIAAAFRDRGVPVIAAPGPNDRAHAENFQRWIGPLRWSFLHKGTAFASDDFPADDAPQSSSTVEVDVRAPRAKGSETIEVPRFSAAGLWHSLALGVLVPLVRSTTGYVAFLCACALAAALVLALTRRRFESATVRPPATSS